MRGKMYRWIAIQRISQIVMVLLALFLAGNSNDANAQSKPEVRLVLQITIDGLRADLIDRYENGFGEGGFRCLLKKGTVYTNAHYQHANTETIVGHTTLATGTFPSQHGMVGNVWFDREAGELAYNIEDPDSPIIIGSCSTRDLSPPCAAHRDATTHVPIIFMGPGIQPQTIYRRVHPVDVAPTIAAFLGMTPPGSAQGSLLEEVVQ